MIEKEFVNLDSLKISWEVIEAALSADKALNEIDLVSFVCEHSKVSRSEASHCLRVFLREGWVIGGSFAGERGGGHLSIGLPLDMEKFLDYYQSRAAKTMDRLNTMIQYAELKSGYKDFINQYFEV